MSLNVLAGLLKIDGDSSGATKALQETKKETEGLEKNTNDLGMSFGSMIGKIAPYVASLAGMVGVMGMAKKSFSIWMDAQKESAQLFNQFGENAWYAASQVKGIITSLESLVKIQTVTRTFNLLSNSEIAATTEQIKALGTMAIQYARSTGSNYDETMSSLTDAVQKGKAKAFIPFGIVLNNTRAEIDANTESLKRFGRAATEEEIQIQKSRNALDLIDKKYKDVKISVDDINDIEIKAGNQKKANYAIAAKMTEGYALELQRLRRSAKGVYTDILESMNGLTRRQGDIQDIMFQGMSDMLPQIAATIRGESADYTKAVSDLSKQIAQKKAELQTIMNSGTGEGGDDAQAELEALERKMSDLKDLKFALPTKQFEALQQAIGSTKDASKLSNDELTKQAEGFLKLQKDAQSASEALKLYDKVTAEMVAKADSPMEKLIANQKRSLLDYAQSYKQQMDEILEKSKEVSESMSNEQMSRDISEVLGKGDDIAKKYESSQKSILDMARVATEIESARLQKQLNFNDLKADEKLHVTSIKTNLEAQADTLSRQLAEMQAQIGIVENAEKGGKKLTSQEKARLDLLKQQYSQMQKQEGSILNQITSLISFVKGIKPADVQGQAKASAEAWVKEYNQTLKVLNGKNDDAKAGILAKYGTDDPKAIKEKMRLEARNKDLTALEKKYADEIIRIEKEKSEAEFAQIEARGVADENEKKRRQDEIKQEIKDESERLSALINPRINYEEKIKELGLNRKVSTEEALKAEKESLLKQIEVISEARDQLDSKRQKLLDTDGLSLEQEKEFASQKENLLKKEYELRKDYKDKTIALKKEENKELTALMKQVGDDLKGYGESLVKTTGGAMWEAMTISNEALKESHMSRSEMQRKALQTELQNIAKQAFIQSLWEGAKSIASYAVGDAKGGTMHAAAALAYGAIAGTSYAISKGISAPSDAEIERRKAKDNQSSDLSSGASSVSGSSSGQKTVVINVYWPQGMIIGDKDTVARAMNNATQDAIRRGRL